MGLSRAVTSLFCTPTRRERICSNALNGHPLSDVKHLAYVARYTADGDTGSVGVPYPRIFLQNDAHDAIFSPNTQPPDPEIGEGPFHTWLRPPACGGTAMMPVLVASTD
jgi:hypothetical protein